MTSSPSESYLKQSDKKKKKEEKKKKKKETGWSGKVTGITLGHMI